MSESRTLLILDDEPNILKALKRVFFEEEYDIHVYSDAEEALGFLKDNRVHLIISDQRMPGMSGVKFLTRAKNLDPDTIRIMLTGYADIEAAVAAINEGEIYKFIFKPWNDEDLRATVKRAFEFYDLNEENNRLLSELVDKNEQLEEWNDTLNQKVKERTSVIVQRNLELGKMTKQLEESIVSTVRVFVNLIELVNPDIAVHSRRVAFIATTIAQDMGLDNNQLQDIEIASLLHDIGKLGIPREITRKSEDRRTEADIKMLVNHPVLGQASLADVERFKNIGRIIRHHHEDWDGTGYPDRLKGESIPLESRLISACNVFDHLKQDGGVSGSAFIVKYFNNNAGKKFDPQICNQILQFQAKHDKSGETTRKAKVLPHELKPGMVLDQKLVTEKGIFLLPQGQVLNETHVVTIREMHKMDPILDSIEVLVPLQSK